MGIEEVEKKDAVLSLLRARVQSLVGELRSIKMASWPNESGPRTDPTALFSPSSVII